MSRQPGPIRRPGSGITEWLPGGASQDERRSHPGTYVPKSCRATGPSTQALLFRLAHLLGWKAQGSSAGRDWRLLIGSFGGSMRESHRSHPKPYKPRSQPSDEPLRQCGSGEPFALFVRFIGGRSPVGSGPSAPAATATPLSGSRPHTGGDPHSARWPNVSLGIPSLYSWQRWIVKKLLDIFRGE